MSAGEVDFRASVIRYRDQWKKSPPAYYGDERDAAASGAVVFMLDRVLMLEQGLREGKCPSEFALKPESCGGFNG